MARPKKPTSEKVVKRMISLAPDSHAYIMKIIEDRKMSVAGSYSKIVNECIKDHMVVKRELDLKRKELEDKLERLK
jgi:hypothetical protein